ncbi:malate dehydrogenase, mitochondrial-like [Anticarsia gemmatalis]|uniref:malate dehydrogenase, mitochondrial-like n=1 Tax=Anticarsia gemmatalis TaxID=129554 RepID=UPI003F76A08E
MLSTTRCIWLNLVNVSKTLNHRAECMFFRNYDRRYKSGCRRALADIPPDPNAVCSEPCKRRSKKTGILHKIKLRVIEGGTNFGTPFRRLECQEPVCKPEKEPEPKALPPPKKKEVAMPAPRAGVQVSILGADTAIGQYVALLLKQCSCIKKIRLYEATDSGGCTRNMCQVVQDLQHIDTNCQVEAFTCACYQLERCLQNSDIVLMLESAFVHSDMPYDKRFYNQAPIVKCYADAISTECPKAFVIVGATPIDCMVPLVAQTLKETGWYNPCKLLGSLAVPEMRASTLAARALCLEPRYTRVPCVGGTEGESLVPLFSKAVEYYDFAQNNAMLMTDVIRTAPRAVARIDEDACARVADLSEAHAMAGLVTKVAHALICNDIPRVTGFVEAIPSDVLSPARFLATQVELSGTGIINNLGLPKMSVAETTRVNLALTELCMKLRLVDDWYCKFCSSSSRLDACQLQFFMPRNYDRFDDCAYATL